MADRGIIFSAPMVRALLDGRKTQTRRVIKDRGVLPDFCGGRFDEKNDPEAWGWEDHERGEWITLDQWRRWTFVPYRPGDRLYVREAWRVPRRFDGVRPVDLQVIEGDLRYEADRKGVVTSDVFGRLRPSIHMPRWASRLTLVVTEVKVQRLQEITPEDSIAEGVECKTCAAMGQSACHGRGCFASVNAFRDLWNSIHGSDAWDQNAWVAAISFDVHRCNIDRMP
jgi:hypothetical protein